MPETRETQTIATDGPNLIRNPYQVLDVPNPNDQEVEEFAAKVKLVGSPEDENARAWDTLSSGAAFHTVEGIWCCRWNGGVDPSLTRELLTQASLSGDISISRRRG
jgi:hypothetical protein